MKRNLACVGIALLVLASPLQAGYMYWSTALGTIDQANMDGTDHQVLLDWHSSAIAFSATAVDAVHGQLFWSDWMEKVIWVMNLDGTGGRGIASTSGSPYDIAVDPFGNNIYWTEGRKIVRSNLDGTDIATVLTMPKGRGYGIALDLEEGLLYWTNTDVGGIYRARLDGTGVTQIASTGLGPGNVSIDTERGKIYWTETNHYVDGGKIFRANLDGSYSERLVSGLGTVSGLALDLESGKMYWTGDEMIQRSNLDGSEREVVLTEQFGAANISLLVPEPSGSLLFLIGCTIVLRVINHGHRPWL